MSDELGPDSQSGFSIHSPLCPAVLLVHLFETLTLAPRLRDSPEPFPARNADYY